MLHKVAWLTLTGQKARQGLGVLVAACAGRPLAHIPELHPDMEETLVAAHPGGGPGNSVLSG